MPPRVAKLDPPKNGYYYRVILVGGPKNMHDKLKRAWGRWGIDIVAHWEYHQSQSSNKPDVDFVACIRDMIGHSQQDKVNSLYGSDTRIIRISSHKNSWYGVFGRLGLEPGKDLWNLQAQERIARSEEPESDPLTHLPTPETPPVADLPEASEKQDLVDACCANPPHVNLILDNLKELISTLEDKCAEDMLSLLRRVQQQMQLRGYKTVMVTPTSVDIE